MRDFLAAFWRAMGDRDLHLQAIRQAAIMMAFLYALLGLAVLSQRLG